MRLTESSCGVHEAWLSVPREAHISASGSMIRRAIGAGLGIADKVLSVSLQMLRVPVGRSLAGVLLRVLVLPGVVSARGIIVAPSGGDFASVAAGVSAAQAGDTVTVRAGIYNEAVSFGRSGSAGAFITLQGEPGAILDGIGRSGQGIIITNRNYIRVVGMTVQNFLGSGTPMGINVEGSSSFIEV